MCTPLAVAGAAVSAGGMAMQNSAAKKAAKQNQADIDRQTDLSAREFDERTRLARESTSRSNDLIERGFTERSDLAGETYRGVSGANLGKISRDTTATDEYFASLAGILDTQGASYDSARADYEAVAEEERARQAGIRSRADARVDTLIADSGFPAAITDRNRAATARNSLVDFATSVAGRQPIDTYQDATGPFADELAFREGQATERAGITADRRSQIAAYGDAAREGTRRIASAGDDLSALDRESRSTIATLPLRLNPSQLVYRQATDRAAGARDLAGGNLEGKLRLSNTDLQRTVRPLTQYADAVDRALNSYYESRLSSEDQYSTGVIGNSQRFEDANRNLTNYRVANNKGASPLGDLMAGFGGSLLSGGISGGGPTWGELGDSINGVFATTKPATVAV